MSLNKLKKNYEWSKQAARAHPLCGVVQHLLPSRVKLSVVILQEPLLSQRDGFLRRTENLCGFLVALAGLLGLQLSLNTQIESY